MDDRRHRRLAELRATEAAENRKGQEVKLSNEIRNDPVRLSQAEALNSRADEYARVHGTDYPTALREVVKLTDQGNAEPSVEEVERHMKAHDIDDFGTALREVISGQQTRALGSLATTASTSVEDENTELAKVLKERGYDD